MNKFTKITAMAIIVISSVGFIANAESHAPMMGDAAAEALMKANGGAVGALAKMAKGDIAFDAVAAQAAKQVLIDNAKMTPEVFKEPFTEGEVLPAIWENYDDFIVKAKAFEDAATALDVTSVETIGAGLGAIGGTCGGCHKLYRKPS
ncbi:MAG: cytochrome c [Deltaproteobacteria bacterium]